MLRLPYLTTRALECVFHLLLLQCHGVASAGASFYNAFLFAFASSILPFDDHLAVVGIPLATAALPLSTQPLLYNHLHRLTILRESRLPNHSLIESRFVRPICHAFTPPYAALPGTAFCNQPVTVVALALLTRSPVELRLIEFCSICIMFHRPTTLFAHRTRVTSRARSPRWHLFWCCCCCSCPTRTAPQTALASTPS